MTKMPSSDAASCYKHPAAAAAGVVGPAAAAAHFPTSPHMISKRINLSEVPVASSQAIIQNNKNNNNNNRDLLSSQLEGLSMSTVGQQQLQQLEKGSAAAAAGEVEMFELELDAAKMELGGGGGGGHGTAAAASGELGQAKGIGGLLNHR